MHSPHDSGEPSLDVFDRSDHKNGAGFPVSYPTVEVATRDRRGSESLQHRVSIDS